MKLSETIRNCKKSKKGFFNLKKNNWVNMDILKPNISFYIDYRREKTFNWEKNTLGYFCDDVDFFKISKYDMGFVMKIL